MNKPMNKKKVKQFIDSNFPPYSELTILEEQIDQFHHFFSQTFRFRANFHRLLAPGSQGGLGRASRDFGEQWGLFQARSSQAASLPRRPFLEGLWELSLLATSGPVETARALLSVGRRCCVFRWPWLGLCLQKA